MSPIPPFKWHWDHKRRCINKLAATIPEHYRNILIMKIRFEKFNKNWADEFENIKLELLKTIGFLKPKIEHIGSTSIKELSAKPIIDILVGLSSEEELDKTIEPLLNQNLVYYEKFNKDMPYRRFFVKYKTNPNELSIPKIITENESIPSNIDEHNHRLAHIHILTVDSEHWIRHIAFRDYLRTFPEIKLEYQKLKENLSEKEWIDGTEYNRAKNDFIKLEEEKAINWFKYSSR